MPMWVLKLQLKIKLIFEKIKKGVKDLYMKVKPVVEENPGAVITVFVGCIAAIAKWGLKAYRTYKASEKLNRSFYDRRRGKWSTSKRNLTPYEKMKIDRMYKEGFSYDEILYSMGILK